MSAKPKAKEGRPTKKTAKLLAEICAKLAEGKSTRLVCTEVGISQRVLWNWLANDEEFMRQYARAKEIGAELLFEEMLDIADDGSNDWMERNDKDNAGYQFNGEHVNRSRLRVDARKWYLSKLVPKKYGERLINEHQGGDPDHPIMQNVTVRFVRPGDIPAKTDA